MYNYNAAVKHTPKQADAIFANIKEKWDSLKEWPDYRGHNEPSDYPRYLHVSVAVGMEKSTDPTTGVVTMVPWKQNLGSYRKPKPQADA